MLCPGFGSPLQNRCGTSWKESHEGPQRQRQDWSISPRRKGRESWNCLAWRRKGSGKFHPHIEIPEWKVQRGCFFAVVPSGRTRHRRFPLNIRTFFTVWVTEKGNGLPKDLVESPSLEILKNVWTWSWTSASRQPCLTRGLHKMTSIGSIQAKPFSDIFAGPQVVSIKPS